MPDQTARLELPLLMPSQAQKHVTHNEAIDRLDGLVQLAIQAFDLDIPPETPTEGAVWHVGPSPSGDWIGKGGKLARRSNNGWDFIAPGEGWIAWDLGAGRARVCLAGQFVSLPANLPEFLQNQAGLGVNTAADATNRLAVSAPATLLTHEGSGHQLKINKATAGDTASLLFQTGWSGRAEMGLAGNDEFAVKVSADGSGFTSAIEVSPSGRVTLPVGLALGPAMAGPALPQDGWIWYDGSTGGFRGQRNGETVGLGGGRNFWPVPQIGEYAMSTTHGAAATTTMAGATNRVEIFPFVAGADMAIDQVAVNVTTGVSAALAKVVFYAADSSGWPTTRLVETSDMDFGSTGLKTAAASLILRQGVVYWLGLRHSSTATTSAWAQSSTPDLNGGSPTTAARKTLRRTLAFATPAPATWGFVSSEITAGVAAAIWLRRA